MGLILSCKKLGKHYTSRPLFSNISFGIYAGDAIGMIGPNGSGKSTLLKLMAKIESPDEGEVTSVRGTRVCYLSQADIFSGNETVLTALNGAQNNLGREDYEIDTQTAIMLDQVGFENPDQQVKTLSGGWRKRLAIACQMIQTPDLLLLDEPTNHLDMEGIEWLEKILAQSRQTFLVVSHDRYFLEQVSQRLIELNKIYPEGHFSTSGSYSDFLEARSIFFKGQLQQQEVLENKFRRELDWLRRGPKARTTKANARIEQAYELQDTLNEVSFRNKQTKTVKINFLDTEQQGQRILFAEKLKKSLGGKLLFEKLDIKLSPGVKLGLLGANGSGKSTLIKVLLGELTKDSGTLKPADDLRVAYFDQNRTELDLNQTLRKALAPSGEQIIYRGHPLHVTSWARKFLFTPEQLDTPLSQLSGGERARIYIARLMQEPANLLVLDEPTNDLDIATLEVLEESLLEFNGAIILVTHDRYMLDRVSTHLLALAGNSTATYYADYSQWKTEQKNFLLKNPLTTILTNKETKSETSSTSKNKKLGFKEQRELDMMEENIFKAEAKVVELQKQMDQITSHAQELQKVCSELSDATQIVDDLYKRWAELSAMK